MIVLKILITGRPGIGKTTLFTKIVSELRRSYSVAGFMCPEVRESGVRVGFKIIDLAGGDEGWLAVSIDRLGGCSGPRIGKYCVLEDEVDRVMARTRASLPMASLIAIDEVGPMELSIRSSREVIELALSMENAGVFVIHYRHVDGVASRLRSSGAPYKLYTLDLANRDKLYFEIVTLVKRIVGSNK